MSRFFNINLILIFTAMFNIYYLNKSNDVPLLVFGITSDPINDNFLMEISQTEILHELNQSSDYIGI